MSNLLTPAQVNELKLAHKLVADKKIADKMKAILMVNDGYSYPEIEKVLLLDESTVRRSLKKFKDRGVNGLLETKYIGGNNKLLTSKQESQLKAFLTKNTQQTTQSIKEHINTVYRKDCSLSGTTKLLHRLGFVYKKPKVIPGKVDLKRQTQFIERYQQIKDNLGEDDNIYFGDATHPTHNTKAEYGWILKGKANDKYIKTNTGRKRLNLNGVVNLNQQTAIVNHEDTINAEAVTKLFEDIKTHQPQGKVYIILDNAKYHHANKVTTWLKKNQRFKILFLPPYSPNLNIIERLWRFYHQKITNNHYFESFEKFKEESLAFFKNLNQYHQELKTLLTDNFQTFNSTQVQSWVGGVYSNTERLN